MKLHTHKHTLAPFHMYILCSLGIPTVSSLVRKTSCQWLMSNKNGLASKEQRIKGRRVKSIALTCGRRRGIDHACPPRQQPRRQDCPTGSATCTATRFYVAHAWCDCVLWQQEQSMHELTSSSVGSALNNLSASSKIRHAMSAGRTSFSSSRLFDAASMSSRSLSTNCALYSTCRAIVAWACETWNIRAATILVQKEENARRRTGDLQL